MGLHDNGLPLRTHALSKEEKPVILQIEQNCLQQLGEEEHLSCSVHCGRSYTFVKKSVIYRSRLIINIEST